MAKRVVNVGSSSEKLDWPESSKKCSEDGAFEDLHLEFLPGEGFDHVSQCMSQGDKGLHLITQGKDLAIVAKDSPWLCNIAFIMKPSVYANSNAQSPFLCLCLILFSIEDLTPLSLEGDEAA